MSSSMHHGGRSNAAAASGSHGSAGAGAGSSNAASSSTASTSGHAKPLSGAQRRKRKREQQAAAGAGPMGGSNVNRPGGPPPQFHQGPGGFPGGPRGPGFPGQMPPPGMHPHMMPSTGMGFGIVEDQGLDDFIIDDTSRLTARDFAMARYKRNHELLNMIFDARRIDSLEPPQSPYAAMDKSALEEKLNGLMQETAAMKQAQKDKAQQWQADAVKHEDMLHAPPKRLKQQREEEEEATLAAIRGEDSDTETPAWARAPFKGRITGVGYVRAATPEAVRAQLPTSPPQSSPTPKMPRQLSAQAPQQPAASQQSNGAAMSTASAASTGPPAAAKDEGAAATTSVAPAQTEPAAAQPVSSEQQAPDVRLPKVEGQQPEELQGASSVAIHTEAQPGQSASPGQAAQIAAGADGDLEGDAEDADGEGDDADAEAEDDEDAEAEDDVEADEEAEAQEAVDRGAHAEADAGAHAEADRQAQAEASLGALEDPGGQVPAVQDPVGGDSEVQNEMGNVAHDEHMLAMGLTDPDPTEQSRDMQNFVASAAEDADNVAPPFASGEDGSLAVEAARGNLDAAALQDTSMQDVAPGTDAGQESDREGVDPVAASDALEGSAGPAVEGQPEHSNVRSDGA